MCRLSPFMPEYRLDANLTQRNAWTLDKLGNWDEFIKRTNDVTITEPRTNNKANEYLTIDPDGSGGASPLTLAHDQNGNLTDDGTYLYEYDIENRMTRVKLKSGTVLLATYDYDALGRRIRKIIPTGQPDAGTWTYVVNELWQVVSEYKTVSSTTTHQRRYVHAGQSAYVDDHVAMWDIVAAKLFYYHADAQYCTVAMTYTAGAVEERYVTDPYGKAVTYTSAWGSPQATSRLGNPFMHQGLWLDGECGKYQNRHRDYLQGLGRFAERDFVEDPFGFRTYKALSNNPCVYRDPTGLIADCSMTNPPIPQLYPSGMSPYHDCENRWWCHYARCMQDHGGLAEQTENGRPDENISRNCREQATIVNGSCAGLSQDPYPPTPAPPPNCTAYDQCMAKAARDWDKCQIDNLTDTTIAGTIGVLIGGTAIAGVCVAGGPIGWVGAGAILCEVGVGAKGAADAYRCNRDRRDDEDDCRNQNPGCPAPPPGAGTPSPTGNSPSGHRL